VALALSQLLQWMFLTSWKRKLMYGEPFREERNAAVRINALLKPARGNSELPTSGGSGHGWPLAFRSAKKGG
jgi:hypothetical protein